MHIHHPILTAIAATVLLAAGCVKEDPSYKKGTEPSPEAGTTGYLTIDDAALRVILDTDTEVRPDKTSTARTRAAQPATRVESDPEAVDGYLVTLSDSKGTTVFDGTYAGLKERIADEGGRMELAVGSYRIEARSELPPTTVPAEPAWDHPVYCGMQEFTIEKDRTTSLDELICTLDNIKVTLMIAADLADQFSPQSQAVITLGGQTKIFGKGEQRAAYFVAEEQVNTLIFSFKGSYADDPDTPIPFADKPITNVKAGQWRKITLIIKHLDEGGIKLDVEVENFVLDQEIVVNATEGVREPTYSEGPDPSAPKLERAGCDLSEPLRITASMFDADGKCTEPFAFDLTAPNGIASFVLTFDSTNPDFLQDLDRMRIPRSLDLCTLTPGDFAYALLYGFGFPLGDDLQGATNRTFDLAGQLPLLYDRPGYNGTHTFAVAMTDALGLTNTAEIRLTVDRASEGAGSKPRITGDGFDLDAVQTPENKDYVIDIETDGGIRSIEVTIDSEELTEAELNSMGIPVRFDLCNIQSLTTESQTYSAEEVAATIQGLGFPVNDEVKGHSSVRFTVSGGFISLLPLVAPGKSDFILSVTDNAGRNETKALKFFAE